MNEMIRTKEKKFDRLYLPMPWYESKNGAAFEHSLSLLPVVTQNVGQTFKTENGYYYCWNPKEPQELKASFMSRNSTWASMLSCSIEVLQRNIFSNEQWIIG